MHRSTGPPPPPPAANKQRWPLLIVRSNKVITSWITCNCTAAYSTNAFLCYAILFVSERTWVCLPNGFLVALASSVVPILKCNEWVCIYPYTNAICIFRPTARRGKNIKLQNFDLLLYLKYKSVYACNSIVFPGQTASIDAPMYICTCIRWVAISMYLTYNIPYFFHVGYTQYHYIYIHLHILPAPEVHQKCLSAPQLRHPFTIASHTALIRWLSIVSV